MGVVIKWSLILAVLVTILSLVIGMTGLHTNPIAGGLLTIGIAIIMNLAVVFMALREKAAENAYGAQLINGLLIGLVGGILIFVSSWTILTFVFPNYLSEMAAGYREFLTSAGIPADQVETQVEAIASSTPASQSLSGLIGTLFTSVIGGALIGIFVRRK